MLHYEVDAHYSLKLHVGERQGHLYFYIVYTYFFKRTDNTTKWPEQSLSEMDDRVKCFDI